MPLSVRVISAAAALLAALFLMQLRFLPSMTVALWIRLWSSVAPLLLGSVVSLPFVPVVFTLPVLVLVILAVGIWAAYRFYPLLVDMRLYQARFARLDEVEHLFLRMPAGDGLVLGSVKQFFFLRSFVCVRPTKTTKEIGNSLIIGRTGGGKGNMLEGQILAWQESLIVNDPKGDLFLKTGGYRATRGPVYVIDPTRGVGHSFDPLHGKTTEDAYLSAARALVFDPKDNDAFWSQSASRMIMQLLKAARREDIAPLVYLRHMIDLGLPAVAKRLDQIEPKLATVFLGATLPEANLASNRTLYGIWSTLQTRLTPFLTETLVRCFTRSDFTPETIMAGERPVTVYLRWEEGELERLAPLIRVICQSIVKGLIAYHDRVQGRNCRPVLLCLDEIGRTPIPDIDGYVATIRSRQIFAQLYAQDFAQLAKNYGEKEAQTISANMDTHVILRPNLKEAAADIEEWLGRGSQYAHSFHTREGNGMSEGLSEQGLPVMTARAIMQMNDKYALIFHRELPPLKAHRLKWWQSATLKARHSLPPPVLPALPEIMELPDRPAGTDAGEDQSLSLSVACVDPDTIRSRRPWRERKEEPEL